MPGTDVAAAAWVASELCWSLACRPGPASCPRRPCWPHGPPRRGRGCRPGATLTERAAVAGLPAGGPGELRRGRGLLPADDGWVALSLVRPDDVDAVPAWLELDGPAVGAVRHRYRHRDVRGHVRGRCPLGAAAAAVAERPVRRLVEARPLLGLPVAAGEAATLVQLAPVDRGGGPTDAAFGAATTCRDGGPPSGPRPFPRRPPRRWWSTCRRCGPGRCAPDAARGGCAWW